MYAAKATGAKTLINIIAMIRITRRIAAANMAIAVSPKNISPIARSTAINTAFSMGP